MHCKNCNFRLESQYTFCPDCGAKIIRNKLTLKNLWNDVAERYFNVDNTFLKTLWHLIAKPEAVINGYIRGIRKQYLNPISYLGIALTISGFIMFFMKKRSHLINFDVLGSGKQSATMQPVFDFTTDFQAILFVLYIPMMAIASWLAYDKVKFNFTERLIVFMYTLAQFSILSFIPSMLVISFYPQQYVKFAFPLILIMYIYSGYVIKRTGKIDGIGFLLRLVVFYIFFTIQYFMLSILVPIILILTGNISIEDWIPKK